MCLSVCKLCLIAIIILLHAVPCCQISVHKFMLSKILHPFGDLETHSKQPFLCLNNLYIINPRTHRFIVRVYAVHCLTKSSVAPSTMVSFGLSFLR